MKATKKILTTSTALLLLASSLACGGKAPTQVAVPEEGPRFPVATPEVRNAVVSREYVAEIRAVRRAELRSRINGILESVSVDEGQVVKEGQSLFQVNARALKQDVLVAKAANLGAEAELRTTQLDLQNTRMLREKKVVSEAELALAEARVQTARARVEETRARGERARVEYDYADVRAPFDGTVNRVPLKAGSAVAQDELLTTLTDASEVYAYFQVSEREYLDYLANATGGDPRRVEFRLVDGSTFPAEGVIDAVASEFDRETGTIAYRARFANANGVLRHGSSGKVVLKTEIAGALVVPQKSTYDVQGDYHVYVLDDNNVAHARKIVVKARLADSFVVESGLSASERFVLDGIQKVREGLRVEVDDAAAVATVAREAE